MYRYTPPGLNLSKLIASHKEMASEFSKVSHCFKYGNLLLFVKDMTYYLSDLMYTKGNKNAKPTLDYLLFV